MLSKAYTILFAVSVIGALMLDRPLVDEILQAIIAVGIIITAYQARQGHKIGQGNAEKLSELHELANGNNAKMTALTASSSRAEGVLEGRQQVQSEQANTSESMRVQDGDKDSFH